MVTKEKVLEALKKFGLLPKEKEDGQILFVFQMTLYVYIPDEDDPNFLAVYIPDFFEFEDDEEDSEIMQVINECNINMKTSKIILAGPKNVWVHMRSMCQMRANWMKWFTGVLSACMTQKLSLKGV